MLQQFKSEITRLQYPHSKRYMEDAIRAFGEDSIMAKDAKIWTDKIDEMFAFLSITKRLQQTTSSKPHTS